MFYFVLLCFTPSIYFFSIFSLFWFSEVWKWSALVWLFCNLTCLVFSMLLDCICGSVSIINFGIFLASISFVPLSVYVPSNIPTTYMLHFVILSRICWIFCFGFVVQMLSHIWLFVTPWTAGFIILYILWVSVWVTSV